MQVTGSLDGSSSSTSSGKGDSLSPSPGSSGSSGDCTDTPPSSTFTCAQQVHILALSLGIR